MSIYVLLNSRIYLGGYDLSGQMNSVTLQYNAEMLDDTTFTTGDTRTSAAGLKSAEITGSIFWEPALPVSTVITVKQDEFIFNRIGAVREVLSICPKIPVVGERVYSVKSVHATYNPLRGEVGQLISSEFNARSSDCPLLPGVIAGAGHKTATGSGTALNLGAVGITQKVYSAIHVFGVTDTVVPTIDVTIESDSADTFLTPTVQLTHTQIGKGIGAGWQEKAGKDVDPVNGITDTWWRAVWTIAGVGAEYDILVALAII